RQSDRRSFRTAGRRAVDRDGGGGVSDIYVRRRRAAQTSRVADVEADGVAPRAIEADRREGGIHAGFITTAGGRACLAEYAVAVQVPLVVKHVGGLAGIARLRGVQPITAAFADGVGPTCVGRGGCGGDVVDVTQDGERVIRVAVDRIAGDQDLAVRLENKTF